MPRGKKAPASKVPDDFAENVEAEQLPEIPIESFPEVKLGREKLTVRKGKGRGKINVVFGEPESNGDFNGEEVVNAPNSDEAWKAKVPVVVEKLSRVRGKKPLLMFDDSADEEAILNESEQVVVAKKRRGRQKKEVVAQEEVAEDAAPKKGRGKAKKVSAEPHVSEIGSVSEEISFEKKKAGRPKKNLSNGKSKGLPTEPQIEGEQHDIAPIVSKKSRSKKVGQEVIQDQLPVADLEAKTEEKTVAESEIKKKPEKRAKKVNPESRIPGKDTVLEEENLEKKKRGRPKKGVSKEKCEELSKISGRSKKNLSNEKSKGLPTEPTIEGEQQDIAPIVFKNSRSKKVGQEVIQDQLPLADLEAETEGNTVAEPDIKKKPGSEGKATPVSASETSIKIHKGRGIFRLSPTCATIRKQDESVGSGSDPAKKQVKSEKKGKGRAKKVNRESRVPGKDTVLEEENPEKKKRGRPKKNVSKEKCEELSKISGRSKKNISNEKSEGLPTEPKIEGEQHDIAPIVSKKSRSKKVGQEVIQDELPVADLEVESEGNTVAKPDIKKKPEKRGKAATTAARSQVDTKLSEAYIEVRKGRGNSRPNNTVVKQDESVGSGSDSAENKKVRGHAKKTAVVIPQKDQQDLVKKRVRNTRAVTSQKDNSEDGSPIEVPAVKRKATGRLKSAVEVISNGDPTESAHVSVQHKVLVTTSPHQTDSSEDWIEPRQSQLHAAH